MKTKSIKKIFKGLGWILAAVAATIVLWASEFSVSAAGPGTGGFVYPGGPGGPAGPGGSQQELRGVWISYLDWEKMPKEEGQFKAHVDAMFDRTVSLGMNAVFVHVHSHGDSMYPSEQYPWSKFASGTQGVSPGYDPLAYMIQAAHSRNLQFHAWFNPYRVTGYLMNWSEVSEQSPAKKWLGDGDPSNDRWVLKHGGAYYYNPSVPQVKEMVVKSVSEVVRNYDVDGIHFDDYFYPELNDTVESKWFDRPEWVSSGSRLGLADWRSEQVSELVSSVYKAVKDAKPSVVFGISPQGYTAHLRSDSKLFVDIDRWMSGTGYIDYIMPQLYWGFETKTPAGAPAPYAFEENLKTWLDLKAKGPVKLYLGLAMYRAGTNTKDYNPVSEWLRRGDIMKRQVEMGRGTRQVSGYCFYAYSSFQEPAAQAEVNNLMGIFR